MRETGTAFTDTDMNCRRVVILDRHTLIKMFYADLGKLAVLVDDRGYPPEVGWFVVSYSPASLCRKRAYA